MGAGYSGPPTPSTLSHDVKADVLQRFKPLGRALYFTDADLLRLFAVFSEWNLNESGVLFEDEMSEAMGWCGDPLQTRFFALLADSPRGVSFRSFVVRLWSLLAVDALSLAHLAFMLYDTNGNGALRLPDLRFMICEVFGTDFEEQACATSLLRSVTQRDLSGNSRGTRIALATFVEVAKINPLLLAPVFALQNALQAATLGVSGWEGLGARITRGLLHGTFSIAAAEAAVNAALGARKRHPWLVVATERHLLPPRTKNPPVRFRLEGLDKTPNLRVHELHETRDFRSDVDVPTCFESIVVDQLKKSRVGQRVIAAAQSFCAVSRWLAYAALARVGASAELLALPLDTSATVAPESSAAAAPTPPPSPAASTPSLVPPAEALFNGETAFTVTRMRRQRRHSLAHRGDPVLSI